ncbi:hypothetical protein PFISCL1PPCAC_2222, partial [Pristionchus fissidentatus]
VAMAVTPRNVAIVFQFILFFSFAVSMLYAFLHMLIMESEPKGDRFARLVSSPLLPIDFPSKLDDVCLPHANETRSAMNLIASMSGFRPILRLIIVVVALIGLLYYIVELTYFAFMSVAVDFLIVTLSTIFYGFKYSNYIFHDITCIEPALLRFFEFIVILADFIVLACASVYLVRLYQCKIVGEIDGKYFQFHEGTLSDVRKLNRTVGYSIKRTKSRRSRKSNRSTKSTVSGPSSVTAKKQKKIRHEKSSRSSSPGTRRSEESHTDPIAESTRSTSISRTKRYP